MRWGRAYFGVQAAAGTAWWIAVPLSETVRTATLGALDPLLVALLDIPLFVVGSALAAAGVRWAAVVATGWTAVVAIGIAVYATTTGLAGWGALVMLAAAGASALALCLVLLGRAPTELLLVGPFAFRPAPPGRTTRHVAATITQMLVFWGAFLVAGPLAIAWVEGRWGLALGVPSWVGPAGAALVAAASGLGAWSALAMSTRGAGTPLPSSTAARLVVAGPYRLVRNPMAVAGILQGVGVGLVLGSWLVVAYAISGSVLWNLAIRPHEEADLEARFGDDFRRYRADVRCWVPGRA